MNKTLVAVLCASLALAACSDKATDNQAASAASAVAVNVCSHQQLSDAVKAQASTHFESIRQYAQQSDLYDEAKLLSILNQLTVQVSNSNAVKDSCQAQLTIGIPAQVIDLAAVNAPLAQQDEPKKILAANTTAGNIRFDGQQLTLPLNFIANNQNGTFTIQTQDENLKSAMRLLANALLPYGIKDTVVYQGKTMSRQEALALLKSPKPIVASAPATIETELEEVQPIANDVSEPPRPEALAETATEMMQPEQPKSTVADRELEAAKEANATADQNIKSAWRKISPDIQQSLVEEQRNWENRKRQSCRNAGAKGGSAAEIQYLQIQCDTRLTRERVQYLNGFSID